MCRRHLPAAGPLAVLLVACGVCGGAEGHPAFQDLLGMAYNDAWLDVAAWDPAQVEQFVAHLAREDFAHLRIDAGRWRQKAIAGSQLTETLWAPMAEPDAAAWGFANDAEKYAYLGFPEGPSDAQQREVQHFKERVDEEVLRRNDIRMRLKAVAKREKRRRQAAKKLELEPGELPEYDDLKKYKLRKLRHFLEMWGEEYSRTIDRDGVLTQAVLVWRREAVRQGKPLPPDDEL